MARRARFPSEGPIGNGYLRKAKKSDISKIVALIKQNQDKLLLRKRREVAALIDSTWVIEEDKQVVGCCILEIYSKKIAEIRSVAVHVDYRDKDYGTALVNAALGEAKRKRVYQVLAVTSSVDFFKSLNFGPCLKERFALFWNGE